MKTQLHLFNCITRTFVMVIIFLYPIVAVAQTVPLDGRGGGFITFQSERNGPNEQLYIMNADGTAQTRLTNNTGSNVCPELSPDSKQITFSSNRTGNFEIYLINIDGSDEKKLTNVAGHDLHASWSPDGSKIAFISSRDGNFEIYTMNLDGSNQKRITNNTWSDENPDWTPDGNRILFCSQVSGNYGIYIMDTTGQNIQLILNSSLWELIPRWSPDGTRIVFTTLLNWQSQRDIWIVNGDGSNPVQLTNTQKVEENASWSPDGTELVYQSDRDGSYQLFLMNPDGNNQRKLSTSQGDYWPSWGRIRLPINHDTVGVLAYAITLPDGNSEIFLINSDGNGKTQLTYEPGRPYGPAFSPDTTKIAFYNHLTDQTWSLYMMNSDGTNIQRLTNTPNILDWSPDWSPDGTKLVFARSFATPVWRSEIWMINPDGSDLHKVSDVDGQGPDWSPDGSKIVYFNYVDGGGDIWVMNADGTNPIKLTDNPSEDWWPKFSPDGSKIAFQSKRDGNHEIYIMDNDGSNIVRLTNNSAYDEDPDWSPDGTKIAFISMRDGHYEIYTMNADGSNQTRITYTNGQAIDPNWKPMIIRDTIVIKDSISVNIHSGWDMISIPIDSMYLSTDLVPSPISEAFYYESDSAKYIAKDTLNSGKGYWLKFSSDGMMKFFVSSTFADTINVKEGWNMIGSISYPVPVELIISDPPGMITSELFTYQSGYVASDTIMPGVGYWIKVDQSGRLFLSTSGYISSSQCIRIAQGDETPPSPPFEVASEGEKSVPLRFALHQNYPNPFNSSTNIRFDIPVKTHIRLEVFNVLGSLVKTLLDGLKDAGSYSVTWDGTDDLNKQVSSGLYLFRLTSGRYIQTQKASLLK